MYCSNRKFVLVILGFCLAALAGCSDSPPRQTGKAPTKPPQERHFTLTANYENNSVRFIDDQLVVDLVLVNSTPHDLADIQLDVTATERASLEPGYKKELKLPNWKKGDPYRVTIPIVKNDLNAYHQPTLPGPPYEITGSARDAQSESNAIEGKILISAQGNCGELGLGAVAFQPWKKWLSMLPTLEPDGKTAFVKLSKNPAAKLPPLRDVELLLVGYIDKVEQFNKKYVVGNWLDEEARSCGAPLALDQ